MRREDDPLMKTSIPIDLIYEIISRLPGKSIARFRCVSKIWCHILRRQDFTNLFLTRSASRQDFTDLLLTRSSSARPRLLITICQKGDQWRVYSTPLPQNPYETWSSNIVAADFLMKKFSKGISHVDCSYASGLIYFHEMCSPMKDGCLKGAICNPLTGQYIHVPELRVRDYSCSYLGFDPIGYEFKVLIMPIMDFIATDCHILTLGTGELRWRKIECPFTHQPFRDRICINGVLYYFARLGGTRIDVIVCFDVRSETFKFIDPECHYGRLINYKGKLCGINLEYDRLSMWVLEDVKWSKYVYSLFPKSGDVKVGRNFSVSGITATGDIVLTMQYLKSTPFYVCYLNPKRKTLRTVELQGLGANRDDDGRGYDVYAFVEDPSVNNALQFKSIPSQQGQQNIVVTKGPKPQQCRHTSSRDLSESTQSVKDKYQVLANMYEEDPSINDAMLQLKSNPSQQGRFFKSRWLSNSI